MKIEKIEKIERMQDVMTTLLNAVIATSIEDLVMKTEEFIFLISANKTEMFRIMANVATLAQATLQLQKACQKSDLYYKHFFLKNIEKFGIPESYDKKYNLVFKQSENYSDCLGEFTFGNICFARKSKISIKNIPESLNLAIVEPSAKHVYNFISEKFYKVLPEKTKKMIMTKTGQLIKFGLTELMQNKAKEYKIIYVIYNFPNNIQQEMKYDYSTTF